MRCLARGSAVVAMLLTFLAVACWTATAEAGKGVSKGGEPVNVLACRLANYREFQDAALPHLPTIGFKYVFMNVPKPDEVEAVQKQLAKHGLKVVVIRGDTDLGRRSCVKELAEQLETCEKLGVKYMFLSPKHNGVEKKVALQAVAASGRDREEAWGHDRSGDAPGHGD